MTPWEALGLRKMRRKSVTTYTERSGERLVIRDLVKLFRPAGRCVVRDRRSRQTYIVEATRHEDGTVFETPLRLTAAGRAPKLSDMQQSPAPSKRRRFTTIILGAAGVGGPSPWGTGAGAPRPAAA